MIRISDSTRQREQLPERFCISVVVDTFEYGSDNSVERLPVLFRKLPAEFTERLLILRENEIVYAPRLFGRGNDLTPLVAYPPGAHKIALLFKLADDLGHCGVLHALYPLEGVPVNFALSLLFEAAYGAEHAELYARHPPIFSAFSSISLRKARFIMAILSPTKSAKKHSNTPF